MSEDIVITVEFLFHDISTSFLDDRILEMMIDRLEEFIDEYDVRFGGVSPDMLVSLSRKKNEDTS